MPVNLPGAQAANIKGPARRCWIRRIPAGFVRIMAEAVHAPADLRPAQPPSKSIISPVSEARNGNRSVSPRQPEEASDYFSLSPEVNTVGDVTVADASSVTNQATLLAPVMAPQPVTSVIPLVAPSSKTPYSVFHCHYFSGACPVRSSGL